MCNAYDMAVGCAVPSLKSFGQEVFKFDIHSMEIGLFFSACDKVDPVTPIAVQRVSIAKWSLVLFSSCFGGTTKLPLKKSIQYIQILYILDYR